MMPKRRRIRAQNRAPRIATERRQTHTARTAQRAESARYTGPAPPHTDNDPPPFSVAGGFASRPLDRGNARRCR